MKLLVNWTMAATLLLLGTYANARDTPAAHAVNNKNISELVMSLISGIYVAGDWGEDPNALALMTVLPR